MKPFTSWTFDVLRFRTIPIAALLANKGHARYSLAKQKLVYSHSRIQRPVDHQWVTRRPNCEFFALTVVATADSGRFKYVFDRLEIIRLGDFFGHDLLTRNACRNRARTEDFDFSCRVIECSGSRPCSSRLMFGRQGDAATMAPRWQRESVQG